MEIKEEVTEMIIDAATKTFNADKSKFNSQTNLEKDFDAKSINFVQIIGELEDEYEVEIDFMAFKNAETIEKEADYVAELL
ncbi:acyl carrier protein [Enterococcus raffinosus]|uniref:acyl carrier protein n=1 Tax=Enterococcus raffinosus TaxID=71452 RepID=UPI001C10DEF6|nr:acyl carrier protein [Enterococcus raffinosus]MBU5362549.1 acyl carrier protein [Enterococcus raffinosus]